VAVIESMVNAMLPSKFLSLFLWITKDVTDTREPKTEGTLQAYTDGMLPGLASHLTVSSTGLKIRSSMRKCLV